MVAAQNVTTSNYNPDFVPGPNIHLKQTLTDPTVFMHPWWATNITDGQPDGPNQTIEFITTVKSGGAIFLANPVISSNGSLSFRIKADTCGLAEVETQIKDGGSVLCLDDLPRGRIVPCICVPDVDCSRSKKFTFTVEVTPINRCPTFNVATPSMTVTEDIGFQRANSAMAGVSIGGGCDQNQLLYWVANVDNKDLFSVRPSVEYSGPPANTANLIFQGAAAKSGTALVDLRLTDDGPTIDGGCNAANCDPPTKCQIRITITKINDPPTYVRVGDTTVQVDENSGRYVDAGWATQWLPGDGSDEIAEQTVQFTVTFTNSACSALFSEQPTVSNVNGDLTFTPKTDYNTDQVSPTYCDADIVIKDSLGLAGCTVGSTCQTVRIVIKPVNSKPTYEVTSGDIVVWEDRWDLDPTPAVPGYSQASWARSISPGSVREAAAPESQSWTFQTTVGNNALFNNGTVQVSTGGTLSFQLQPHKNGQSTARATIVDSLGLYGTTTDFNVVVLPVNDPPVFTVVPVPPATIKMNANVTVISPFLSNIAPGPAEATDEIDQDLNLDAQCVPSTLCASKPLLRWIGPSSAELVWQPAPFVAGSGFINVTVVDNGGTDRRGKDRTMQSFPIVITGVNQPPEVTLTRPSIALLEQSAITPYVYPGVISVASSGVGEAAGSQTVTLSISAFTDAVPTLFASAPTLAQNGTLAFQLAADVYGTATVVVTASDNGTPPLSVTLAPIVFSVALVNRAPFFNVSYPLTNGTLLACPADSVAPCSKSFPGWATAMAVGPVSEQGKQTLSFIIDTSNVGFLFSSVPTIDPVTGTLAVLLNQGANTVATGPLTMTVTLKDTGGTANGGVNVFSKSVLVSVPTVATVPRFTVSPTPVRTLENTIEMQSVVNWLSGIDTGNSAQPDTSKLAISIVATRKSLFTIQPYLNMSSTTSATLFYAAAPFESGSTSLAIIVRDTVSGLQTIGEGTITIVWVNQRPSFDWAGSGGGSTGMSIHVRAFQDTSGDISRQVASNISSGRGDPAQGLSFSMSCTVSSPAGGILFASYTPAVDANGTMKFQLQPLAKGRAGCTLRLRDDGGVENGGTDVTDPVSFDVIVDAVNHAPTFTPGASQVSVLQTAPSALIARWATLISVGPTDETEGQAVSFEVSCDTVALFSVLPAVSGTTGDLTFAPAGNTSGVSYCTVAAIDSGPRTPSPPHVYRSAAQSIRIAVLFVNQAPTFTLLNRSLSLFRGQSFSGVVAIDASAGPLWEANQTVRYEARALTNSLLFKGAITITHAGLLQFRSDEAIASGGVSEVSVCVVDNGGTANGGSDTLCRSISVSISASLLQPAISGSNTSLVLKQRAPQTTIPGFLKVLTSVNDPQMATLSVSVMSQQAMQDAGLPAPRCTNTDFLVQPAVSMAAGGQLTFQFTQAFYGSCRFTVAFTETTGLTATVNVSATVLQVNVAPSFSPGPNVNVPALAGVVQTRVAWARDVTVGPSDESTQTTSFRTRLLTSSAAFIPTGLPVVYANGTLAFALAANAPTVASFEVSLVDNAGTLNGGADTSIQAVVTITALGINTAPLFDSLYSAAALTSSGVGNQSSSAAGSSLPAAVAVSEGSGVNVVRGWARNIRVGSNDWETQQQTLTFLVTPNNTAAVATLPAPFVDPATGDFSFTLVTTFVGVVEFSMQARDNGGRDNGGNDTSSLATLLVQSLSVNHAPSVVVAVSPVYLSQGLATLIDPFLVDVAPGPAHEAYQRVSLQLRFAADASLLAQQAFELIELRNAMSLAPGAQASLAVIPRAAFTGSVKVTVVATDDGGTERGGVASSTTDVTVTILRRNRPPVVNVSSTVIYLSSALAPKLPDGAPVGTRVVKLNAATGEFSVPGLLTGLTNGGEADETVALSVATGGDAASLFDSAVSFDTVAAGGTLRGKLSEAALDRAGREAVDVAMTVIAKDSGGTTNGGVDTTTMTLTLTVMRRPAQPSVTLASTMGQSAAIVLPGSVAVTTAPLLRVAVSSEAATARVVQAFASNQANNASVLFAVRVEGTTSTIAASLGNVAIHPLTGELTITTKSSSTPASDPIRVYIIATNADGAAQEGLVFMSVVVPAAARVTLAQDSTSFQVDVFRQGVASVFGVTIAQVVVTRVTFGSVNVDFYIDGLQPAMTSASFTQKVMNPSDPASAIVPAVVTATPLDASSSGASGNPTTSPSPTTTTLNPIASVPPEPFSRAWVDANLTWIIVGACVILVLIIVIVVACVCCRKKGQDGAPSAAGSGAEGSTSRGAKSAARAPGDDGEEAEEEFDDIGHPAAANPVRGAFAASSSAQPHRPRQTVRSDPQRTGTVYSPHEGELYSAYDNDDDIPDEGDFLDVDVDEPRSSRTTQQHTAIDVRSQPRQRSASLGRWQSQNDPDANPIERQSWTGSSGAAGRSRVAAGPSRWDSTTRASRPTARPPGGGIAINYY